MVTIPRVELGGISIAACPLRFLTYAIAVFLLVSISKPSVASPCVNRNLALRTIKRRRVSTIGDSRSRFVQSTLSASNIERYLAAAEFVLAEAYPKSKPAFFESTKKARLEKQIDEPHREQLRAAGLLDKVRFEMWPGDIFRYSGPEQPLPEAGIYEISYTLSGLKPEKGRAPARRTILWLGMNFISRL